MSLTNADKEFINELIDKKIDPVMNKLDSILYEMQEYRMEQVVASHQLEKLEEIHAQELGLNT